MYLLGLGLVIVLGVLLTAPLTGSLSRLERVAIGWGVGLGFVTLILFLLSAIGLPLRPAVVWAVVTVPVLILASWRLLWHSQPVSPSASDLQLSELPHSRLALTSLEALLLFLLLISLAVTVFQAVYWPIYDNDSLVNFDFRARLMVQHGTIDIVEYTGKGFHLFYPPLVPLGYSMIYWLGGDQGKLITIGCWLSLLAVLYGRLRRGGTSRLVSLFALVLLTYSPIAVLFATHGMTNIPFAFYLAVAAIYMDAWVRGRCAELPLLSAVLLGLAAWTRSDGLAFAVASWGWMFLSMLAKRPRKWIMWIVGAAFVFGPALLWQVYITQVEGVGGMAAAPWFLTLDAGRFLGTVWALIAQILDPRIFGGIGAAFMLALLLALYFRRLPSVPLLTLIGLYGVVWITLFYVIELESRYATLYNSGQRILIAIAPLLVYHAALSSNLQRLVDGIDQAINRWIVTGR